MKSYRKTEPYARRTLSPQPLKARFPSIYARHTRRSSAIPNPSPPSSFKLSHFRLHRTIGTGTFARVRITKHKASNTTMVLKIMKKSLIIQKQQVDHVKNERRILTELSNPFIVQLLGTFQDRKNLYLVLEYIPGGELYSQLRIQGKLTDSHARFYTSQIFSVFSFLHSHRVMYRDLKPENVLIDKNGHLKLVDFGFVKQLDQGEKTYTLCGTPEYLAPEVIMGVGHQFAVDWWTLGVFLYEMINGKPPFVDKSPYQIYSKVLENEVKFQQGVSKEARGLVEGLLNKNPDLRMKEEEIRDHEFFVTVDWKEVENQETCPPFRPKLKGNDDSSYFDSYKEEKVSKQKSPVRVKDPDLFSEF